MSPLVPPETQPDLEETAQPPTPSKTRHWSIPLLLFVLLAALAITATAALLLLRSWSQPEFLLPVPEHPNVLSSGDTPPTPKEIIGFFPYWNLKYEEHQRYHLLSQVVFFGLQIDTDGNIVNRLPDDTQEPGWTAFRSQKFSALFRKAKDSGAKVLVAFQATDTDTIDSFLADPQKRQRFIKNSLEIIEQKNLDGLNIDIEYAGSPPVSTTKNMTSLVKELRDAMRKKNESLILSVDVFADATNKVRIWDIPSLAEAVDWIIVMAYDFHRAASPRSGPVAPAYGAPLLWEYDLTKTVADFSRSIPLTKLILGVPYYGYEWQTTSTEAYAPSYPQTGATASYQRVQEILEEKDTLRSWDETALAPRLSYKSGNATYQIYYENEASLGWKYDLVNQSGIEGIAIWALGYDGEHPNLWNLLAEKFPHQ